MEIGGAESCFHREKLGVVFDWNMERIKRMDKEEIKPFLLLWGQLKKFFTLLEHLVLQCQSRRPCGTGKPSNRPK